MVWIGNLSASWLIGTAPTGRVRCCFLCASHPFHECTDTPRGDGSSEPLAAHSPWQGLFQIIPTHPTGAVPNTWSTSRGSSCLGDALGVAFPLPEPGAIPWASLAGFHLAGLDPAQRQLLYPFCSCFTPSEVPRVRDAHSAAASPAQPKSLLCFQLWDPAPTAPSPAGSSPFLPSSCFQQFRCAPAGPQVSPFTLTSQEDRLHMGCSQ